MMMVKSSAYKKRLSAHVNRRGDCDIDVTESCAHYWFTIINKAAFDNKLPRPTIVIRSMKKYYGHCEVKRTGAIIEISSNIKNRKVFLATVAHEMVHLFQWYRFGTMDHGQEYITWKRLFKERYRLIL